MAANNDRQMRIGATLINKYYHALMTKPEELLALYLPKVSFNHENKVVTTPEAIRKSLRALYADIGKNARVTVQAMALVKSGEQRAFGVDVTGTMHLKSGAREFKHVLEIQEHGQVGSNAFGVFADTLRFADDKSKALPAGQPSPPIQPKGKFLWSEVTPPMNATEGDLEEIPPIQMTPSVVEATKKAPTPKQSPALKPAVPKAEPKPEPVAEAKPVEPVAEEPKAAEAPAASAPKSFADLLRRGGAAPAAPAAKPQVVVSAKAEEPKAEAKPEKKKEGKKEKEAAKEKPAEETKPEEPKAVEPKKAEEKPAAAEAPKAAPAGNWAAKAGAWGKPAAAAAPATTVAPTVAPAAAPAAAPKAEKTEKAEKEEKPAAKASSSEDKRSMSRTVVFYNAFINNLPADTTEAALREKLEPLVKLQEVKINTKKTDSGITRCFAFVKFDKSVTDVPATLALIKSKKLMVGTNEMNIDIVHEKYSPADKSAAKSGERRAPKKE